MITELKLLLSKVVPLVLLPEGLITLALIGVCLSLRIRAYRAAGRLTALALVVFWVASTPVAAKWLTRSLERQYLPPSAALPSADVAIVLGGALQPPVEPLDMIDLTDSADRVWYGARLYKAGRVKRIVVVGGNMPWHDEPRPEAELIRDVLIDFGVPAEAIQIGGTSRNTYENAIEAKAVLKGPPFDTALLVTSAWHMPRAIAVFRKAGIPVDPAPCDFRIGRLLDGTILDWLPQAGWFAVTSAALREWIGYYAYRLQGWV